MQVHVYSLYLSILIKKNALMITGGGSLLFNFDNDAPSPYNRNSVTSTES